VRPGQHPARPSIVLREPASGRGCVFEATLPARKPVDGRAVQFASMNDIATHFLQTYAAGGEVDGGWLFGKALQQARLDYSPESLVRLDALLAQIRERAKPGRSELDTPQGQNFEALVVFYLLEIVHRLSRVEIVWHDRASGLRALPAGTQLPEGPAARILASAPDHGAILYPLAWLEAQVLADGKRLKAGDFVASLVAQLERDGPAEWWAVANAAGRMASWQMEGLASGEPALASMASQTAPRTLTVVSESLRPEDQLKAVEYGVRLLETNPDGATWQVLSYNGYLDDENGRLDAVIVFAATYGEKGARMVMAFPYRPGREGRPFEILRPKLREANLTVETMGKLNTALERGIREAPWASGASWDQFYRG